MIFPGPPAHAPRLSDICLAADCCSWPASGSRRRRCPFSFSCPVDVPRTSCGRAPGGAARALISASSAHALQTAVVCGPSGPAAGLDLWACCRPDLPAFEGSRGARPGTASLWDRPDRLLPVALRSSCPASAGLLKRGTRLASFPEAGPSSRTAGAQAGAG